jgi:hypothetical protein
MRRPNILLMAPLLLALAGCNQMMASPGQFDAVRVRLTEDKKFRDDVYRRCVKDFASAQSVGKLIGILMATQPKAAVDLVCRRAIAAVIEKRLTYNDLANLRRMSR